MKISKLMFALLGCVFIGDACAANITIYHSPRCPHCRNARDFISSTLIYEYDDLKVSEVDVTNIDNRQAVVDAMYKCGYQKGAVPIIVIGEKCFQGYSDALQGEMRTAVEVDLTDAQKSAAAANKAEMAKDKEAFVAARANRINAIVEVKPAKKN